MTAAVTIAYVDHTPSAAEIARVERHVERRGFSPIAPVAPATARKTPYALADGEDIERLLVECRELLLNNDFVRALAKLEAAQTLSDAHAELPHAAFLESELARAFAETHEALGNHEQAASALERARTLDGGRAMALSEHLATVTVAENSAPKTAELRISIHGSNAQAANETEIWLDGARLRQSNDQPLATRLPVGKHHLRVRHEGNVIATQWLVLDKDTTREIQLPAPVPCSVREFEGLTQPSRGFAIACRNWFSVRKVANRTLVRFCHQEQCDGGVWVDGAEADASKGRPWIPWALVGALGASAVALTVLNLQTTSRSDAKFVNGGLTLASPR
jgi:hypothetical protein